MSKHLVDVLDQNRIGFEVLSKSVKVRLLARWSKEFPSLDARARRRAETPLVFVDNAADAQLDSLKTDGFFILPDDNSAMASVRCDAPTIPKLSALVSDTVTTCDEIVIIDSAFSWSCILVNHGTIGVGRYFMRRNPDTDG